MSYIRIAMLVGVAVAIGAAILFFHLYTKQVEANGTLKQSNVQLQQTITDKANAQKSRANVEQRNRSVDYPTLVDKLR